jgi:ferrous iron transport protein A
MGIKSSKTNGNEPSELESKSAPVNGAIPLSAMHTGERGIVVELMGGQGLLSRMTALGLTPGAEVVVVQNFGRGPLIARVRDARIALGRGEASKIRVRR